MKNDYFKALDHGILLENIKGAATCEAKVDALAELVYKIVINDLDGLDKRIRGLEEFRWKAVGAIGVLSFLASLLVRMLFK